MLAAVAQRRRLLGWQRAPGLFRADLWPRHRRETERFLAGRFRRLIHHGNTES